MDIRFQALRDYILAEKHHAFRHTVEWHLAEEFAAKGTPPVLRRAIALEKVLAAEEPRFLPDERIAGLRTVANLPALFTDEEWAAIRQKHSFSEQGMPFNFTPDYPTVIAYGLEAVRKDASARLAQAEAEGDEAGVQFLHAGIQSIDAVLDFAEKYRRSAEAQGLGEIAKTLAQVPRRGARTTLEAMQSFRVNSHTPIERLELSRGSPAPGWASRSIPTTMWCCPRWRRDFLRRRTAAPYILFKGGSRAAPGSDVRRGGDLRSCVGGGLREVQLLPYHPGGEAKLRQLGRSSRMPEMPALPVNPKALEIFRSAELPCAWPFGSFPTPPVGG